MASPAPDIHLPDRTAPDRRPDWMVLALLCLAQFMVVLDVSIVNVALPSIRGELGFSSSGLQWVVNAYTLAFAGFLLLGGRAADLFGRRRMFLIGLSLFTAASLAGGLAQDQTTLLLARFAQGLGAAVLSPATLTILTTTFTDGPRRAKALGAWSAVAGAGGAAGALLGGVLTDLVSWRWILFVNVPIGLLGLVAARQLLSNTRDERAPRHLDLLGAMLVTLGLMTLVYGIVGTTQHGWTSSRTLGILGTAVVLLGWFLVHEARVAAVPIMPLSLFRIRSVTSANLVMLGVGGAVFASWYFLSLYMQNVLGYSPLTTGLAFLPQTFAIIIGAQVSSRLVNRLGPRPLMIVGPTLSAAGLLLLSRIGTHGHYLTSLLLPSVMLTLGVGLAFTPITFAAMSSIDRSQAGLASGLVNTSRQVGGSVGLAVLATVATDRTHSALAARHMAQSAFAPGRATGFVAQAFTSGYSRAFAVSAGIALLAALASLSLPVARPERADASVSSARASAPTPELALE